MIDSNQTLGHVAAEHPASTLVFLRHRLDFCCGGGQRLGDACRHVGLDPAAVIQEIEAEGATRSPERWDTKPLPELMLEAGDIGTVVLVHANGAGFEVEFVTLAGETHAVTTLTADHVRPIDRREIASARMLAA